MFNEKYANQFEIFSLAHFLVIGFSLIMIVGTYFLSKRLARSKSKHRILRYTVAFLMVAMEVTYQVWWGVKHGFQINSIPLGLCAITMWLTVVALILDSKKMFKILLPWAIVGALLSIIVVDIEGGYIFPHFRFIHYFLLHLVFLLVNLGYLFSGKIRPYRYKDLAKSSLVLLIYTVLVGVVVNIIFKDANFLFLRALPSELDFIHKYIKSPWHAPVLAAAIFALMNVIYLPIHFTNKKIE